MNKHNIIRFLAGLSFLIFFCPFFQMCSDDSILIKRYEEAQAIEETPNSIALEEITTEKSKTIVVQSPEERIRKEQELLENRKIYTLNGYELAFLSFNKIDELALDVVFDSGFLFLSLYTFTFVLMLIIFISALRKRMKVIYWFSITILFLIMLSMLIFVFDPLFEEISQIKFGYYLFIINTLALIIFSRKFKPANAV